MGQRFKGENEAIKMVEDIMNNCIKNTSSWGQMTNKIFRAL